MTTIPPESASPAPRTATAVERPCQLYSYHWPRPLRTQGHHRHPVYLQNRVYGHIIDNELLWVCGTCHDSLHEVISHLLGEGRKPSGHVGRKLRAEAQRTVTWYWSAFKDALGTGV